MNAWKRTLFAAAALLVALTLVAGPVAATEDEPPANATEAPAGDEGRKPPIAETPRDRVGLILLGLLAAAGVLGLMNARRQLKGERPQATGEFRWR